MLFTKVLNKNMGKVSIANELRDKLRENFQKNRGAHAAFCREHNVSSTWLTWVLQGKHNAPELLLTAADWLPEYLQRKQLEAAHLEDALASRMAKLP